jgi:hypothetical protein
MPAHNDQSTKCGPLNSTEIPFKYTESFAVNLKASKILPQPGIPGDVLVNEPITGSTVVGSTVDGTVFGGLAHPSVDGNGTF